MSWTAARRRPPVGRLLADARRRGSARTSPSSRTASATTWARTSRATTCGSDDASRRSTRRPPASTRCSGSTPPTDGGGLRPTPASAARAGSAPRPRDRGLGCQPGERHAGDAHGVEQEALPAPGSAVRWRPARRGWRASAPGCGPWPGTGCWPRRAAGPAHRCAAPAVAFSAYAAPKMVRTHSAKHDDHDDQRDEQPIQVTGQSRTCGPSGTPVWTDSTVNDAAMLMGTSVSAVMMVQVMAK